MGYIILCTACGYDFWLVVMIFHVLLGHRKYRDLKKAGQDRSIAQDRYNLVFDADMLIMAVLDSVSC